MKLVTKETDQGGNLYAAEWVIDIHWEKRLLQIVKKLGDNHISLMWYSFPSNKEIMFWDHDVELSEIMDFVANLPEKRDLAEFKLP
jgi:hypothetical protein